MSATASLAWFARHELRLSWRDWLAMLTAGRRGRERVVAVAVLVFLVAMHLIAYAVVEGYAHVGPDAGKTVLFAISCSAVLTWTLMLSQGMESVTRAFYARAD